MFIHIVQHDRLYIHYSRTHLLDCNLGSRKYEYELPTWLLLTWSLSYYLHIIPYPIRMDFYLRLSNPKEVANYL